MKVTMGSNFDFAYRRTNMLEGGYVHDPVDRGGETYGGISRKNHPGWAGWNIIDRHKKIPGFVVMTVSKKNEILGKDTELQALHRKFYLDKFWNKAKCGLLDRELASKVYDMCVNMGVKTGVKVLQGALDLLLVRNIVVDGVIGKETLGGIRDCQRDVLLHTINVLHGMRYVEIIRRDGSQRKFVNGWMRRVFF